MRSMLRCALLSGAVVLGACATNPPLLFADSTSFGLMLGTESAAGGGSVSVGLEARSLAVVPVTTLDHRGISSRLEAHRGDVSDAMSVVAVFKSKSEGTTKLVDAGQLFATGLAAQQLTMGFRCRLEGQKSCVDTADQAGPAAAAASAAARSALAAAGSAAAAKSIADGMKAPDGPSSSERPYQHPLVFARTDSVGIGIGGTLAEQGLAFKLGFASRNLALVPVIAPSIDHKVASVRSEGGGSKDSLSVLGQFDVNSKTTSADFKLERYFATGVAARNLAAGLRASIAAGAASSSAGTASTTPAAPATGAAP